MRTTRLQVPAGRPPATRLRAAEVLGSVIVPAPGEFEAKNRPAWVGSVGFANWSNTTTPLASVTVSGTAVFGSVPRSVKIAWAGADTSCSTMEMLAVPAGTLKVSVVPTFFVPSAKA